ncbi:carbohydrate ABC transporter permease [Paenibacillus donghaensis]|uniref:ABC transporter permease n=1 Tax=Paenibacillus donghaensis TaxID=414771 RepID=A0A2Z2KNC9_9BACL|nr:carbohydrate ABC transporter permease [Paenibacillus donghaensis]ASA21601.1 ABC transporter permease [Paenibacillus donghaensis]
MKSFDGTLAVQPKKRVDIWGLLIGLVLIIISLVCLLPFVHVVAKSFSEDAFVIANKVFLWPKGFSVEAYKKIFADQSILRSFYISVIVTVLFTFIGMVITILAAYALSRQQLRWRTALTMIFTFPLFFHGGIIPEYMMINNLGMLDTIWSLILPLAFSSFNLIVMKSALSSSIPVSLEESARIDGAGHFRILWSIVLPLSKPIIATLSLFYAVGRWNSYQDALFYIKQNTDLRPLQLKLYYLIIQGSESFQLEATQVSLSNPEILKASCVVFATVPILLIYPFIQKYFVQGVMLGAIKE